MARRVRGWIAGGLLLVATPAAPAAAEMPLERRIEIFRFVDSALHGDAEAVAERLDAGMPVDATEPPDDPRSPYTKRTALEAAAIYGHLDLVRLLLARGATLRRDERHGIYPASMHHGDQPKLLALLLAHAGPTLDLDADFGPALVRGAANGATGEVAFLLELGVGPDFRGPDEPWNGPAIVRAGTHFEIVDLLLAAGANPTGGDLPYRWSLLFPAAFASDAARTRQFLDLGIDPHVRGDRGNALSVAACTTPRTVRPTPEAKARTNAVAGLLLARDVDPNVRNRGRTPLRCAEDSRDAELAAALEAAGGRSRESLWSQVKRGASVAGMSIVLMLGGGM